MDGVARGGELVLAVAYVMRSKIWAGVRFLRASEICSGSGKELHTLAPYQASAHPSTISCGARYRRTERRASIQICLAYDSVAWLRVGILCPRVYQRLALGRLAKLSADPPQLKPFRVVRCLHPYAQHAEQEGLGALPPISLLNDLEWLCCTLPELMFASCNQFLRFGTTGLGRAQLISSQGQEPLRSSRIPPGGHEQQGIPGLDQQRRCAEIQPGTMPCWKLARHRALDRSYPSARAPRAS